MRAAWRITAKDLLLRLRDRSALLVGMVIPFVLAFIFNAVFGGAFGGGTITTIGFADEDGGEVSQGLGEALASLDAQGTVATAVVEDRAGVRAGVEGGDFPAGIVVPEGFSAAALAGEEVELEVVAAVDAPTAASVARGIAEGFATGIEDAQRAVQAVLASGEAVDGGRIAEVAEAAATAGPLVTIGPVAAADRVIDPPTFYSAGMAVFFLFFLVQFGVTGLIDEEREGTLTRLQAAPIPRWSIVVGKGLTSFLLGVVALAVLAVASSLLMGADWGSPAGLGVLIVAVTLSATSILGIVAALARTPEGAGNLVAVIAVGMGMLGGTFFPVGSNNRLLELMSRATPHSWFLQGIGDLQGDGSLGAVMPSVAALLVFAAAGGALASVLLARRFR
ncbi:MAG: ABC transporter permease [Actinomycetota bacterium]